jgi:signal-transduction protein with cAMP-binding, CBS, and nucleotidyltransferase domain
MSTLSDVIETKGHDVYSTTVHATIDSAVTEMCRVKVGALLVRDDHGGPVGMLSERDLLVRVLLAHKDPHTTTVDEVMTRKIICVELDRTVTEAMAIMTSVRCRHLPVVVNGTVVGIVSIGDLVRVMSGDQEYELRTLHEYVEGRYMAS